MATRRIQRLNEQLKREIAEILRSQVHDPRVLGVTVTGVEASRDLTSARVWVLLSEDREKRKTTLAGLNAASPFIRRQLGSGLRIRRVPELDFREDPTLERAFRIEEILREVRPGEEDPDSGAEATEEDPGQEEDPER